jgi:hypothetical protein
MTRVYHVGSTLDVTHELKVWPEEFEKVWVGDKTHEYRRNDRGYKVGDVLLLREFQPVGEIYTGRELVAKISAISRGPEWGIPWGYATFSVRILRQAEVIS